MRSWLKVIPLAAGMMVAGTAAVQAQGVAGTYTWEQAMMMRRGGDGSTMDEGAKAQIRLVLEVRGDSVFGSYTLQPPATEGATIAPQAREVKGTVTGNKVVLVMKHPGRVNINGSSTDVNMTTTFTATVEGDELKGTIDMYAPELPASPPSRPFTAKRVS